jgi:hypothetical protein
VEVGAAAAARRDDEVTDAPAPDRSRSALLRLVLAGVLAVALVFSIAWLAVGITRRADAEESRQAARDAVMLRVREYVKEAWNYGKADLDDQNKLSGYSDRVKPLITTSFATDFDKALPAIEQLIAQQGFARTTTLDHVGVERLDDDSATVLVNGQITETQRGKQLQPSPYFWRLDLDRVDGTWRVSDLSGVGGGAQ